MLKLQAERYLLLRSHLDRVDTVLGLYLYYLPFPFHDPTLTTYIQVFLRNRVKQTACRWFGMDFQLWACDVIRWSCNASSRVECRLEELWLKNIFVRCRALRPVEARSGDLGISSKLKLGGLLPVIHCVVHHDIQRNPGWTTFRQFKAKLARETYSPKDVLYISSIRLRIDRYTYLSQ